MFTHIVRAGLVLALSTAAALAQSAVFSGKVTSAGQPLGGASVGIVELGVGATTAVDGTYSFTVPVGANAGRSVTLRARAIGYTPKQATVALAAGRIEKEFALDKDVLNLEQVVVTGVGDATSQKKTAFSVGVVDASQIKEAPSSSPVGALAGRVAGASVVTVSGQPGQAPAIRLRAATSLTGSADPLIIIDGTITRMTLADINTEDVERMEVIKGAAASSLYGSDAANGVVQIFTKRGAQLAEGQTSFQLRNEYGQSWLPNKVPGNTAHEFRLLPDGDFARDANGNRIQEADRIADNPYPVIYDQLGQVFRPGTFMTNYASVGQRRGSTNFNVSFQNSRESGVLGLLNGFSRQNFRMNLDQAITDQLTFQAGAFYGRSNSDEAENTGIFFGLRFLEPNVDLLAPNADGSPFNAAIKQPPLSGNVVNPLYGLANRDISRDRDRFNGTFKLTYKPLSWLTAEGNINYEQSGDMYKSFTPTGFLNSAGASDDGSLFQSSTLARTSNIGATLTAVRNFEWFTNTTKLAYVFEDQSVNNVNVFAASLTVPKVPEFSSADPAQDIFPGSRSVTIRNQNLFAITTFDIRDRYIFDALVRQDQSSLFGADQRTAIYNRVSAAYRLSEDLPLPGIDEFKLRASYGTAGLRPGFDAQYEIFSLVGGSPTPVTLGNRDLRPAFSKETEVGFNLTFLRNFTFEYSYSDKVTSDQILLAPVSAATGYRNTWTNAGTLAGQTHEAALGAVLLSTGDMFWRLNVTADRTRQQITDLKVAPFLAGPDGNTSLFRVGAGEPFGVIYGSKWIRTPEQLAATLQSGKNPSVTGTAANYRLNEEGFYVRTADWRTINEKPLKAYTATGESVVQIGDVNPDLNLAINSTFQWGGFSLNALITMVQGGDIYNYTRQWPFNEQRDPLYDQRGRAEEEKKPVSYYQTFYNNFDANDFFVENGSYIRLRELSVNYQLPKAFVQPLSFLGFENARLGIVGRNLWTSTKYTGYDPDVTGTSGLGGNPFVYRVDYFTYPQFRTFTMMVELGF
ncbi:MAG: SusC/RagA family TonB-linked outer membrane protein [Gemmatimonadetes bacterium]|nr:SusC/RagA family TonB-linked outer membrane protein [Gemmatimonadota bacterium]